MSPPSTPTPQGRPSRQGRGGRGGRGGEGRGKSRGRGRGRGRGGGRGGRRGKSNKGGSGTGTGRGNPHSDTNGKHNAGILSNMSDEQVMIAFMQHLRKGNDEARGIHLEYGSSQNAFIQKAREFLSEKDFSDSAPSDGTSMANGHESSSNGNGATATSPKSIKKNEKAPMNKVEMRPQEVPMAEPVTPIKSTQLPMPSRKVQNQKNDHEMEKMVANLTVNDDAALRNSVPVPSAAHNTSTSTPSLSPMRHPPGMPMSTAQRTPPPPPQTGRIQQSRLPSPSPLSSVHHNHTKVDLGTSTSTGLSQSMAPRTSHSHVPTRGPMNPVPVPIQVPSNTVPPATPATPVTPATVTNESQPPPETPAKTTAPAPAPAPAPKWQPKRLNTRLQEQPGRILANNAPATLTGKPYLILRPRKELVATWQLPLDYLRKRTIRRLQEAKEKAEAEAEAEDGTATATAAPSPPQENLTIRDALRSLTVGLFRRGCQENGSNQSIISKEVVPADTTKTGEYHFEMNQNTIWGTVPFFTPRTPGNVVLRLYFEDEPLYTLATSRCISVKVSPHDAEQTLRFILSNFKSKRGSTNFSSIHSLAAVLKQYSPISSNGNGGKSHSHSHSHYRGHDHVQMSGEGRAAWGGICESRKVVNSERLSFLKKKVKLDKQIAELEDQKKELDARHNKEAAPNEEGNTEATVDEDPQDPLKDEMNEWKEQMNQAMGERASLERKWREIQSAFASVLKSVVNNSDSSQLLKPDIVQKLNLEYQLWCPLCESFAPNPLEEEPSDGANFKYPHPIQKKHFLMFAESRSKMQQKALGFVCKTEFLSPNAYLNDTGVCARLTKAMGKLYETEYGASSSLANRKKSLVRELAESAVSKCDAFPQGTRVVVFGSSANGFGSPKSDLDMCLQLPQGAAALAGEEGATAMGLLAEKLEEAGMLDVDTARLTARIPVIKFDCRVQVDGSESLIECDISMQNPLACINTSLLHSYSTISPSVRVLAAVVKRWAKRRNINDPSHHTLSSYGYIIMLLHFLTTHQAAKDGGIESIFYRRGHQCPLLPNLQWVDHRWLQGQTNNQYTEWQQKPANQYTTMKHPTETSYVVNTSFLRINDQNILSALKQKMEKCSLPTPPVGYLLASFFRYYAFEFDFKKHIVSLNAISQSGPIEREGKAESDVWKLYGQSLSIEDPFEEFYDVAHVLKNVNFQKTRREFALAYSKIASSMLENQNVDAEQLLESICEETGDSA